MMTRHTLSMLTLLAVAPALAAQAQDTSDAAPDADQAPAPRKTLRVSAGYAGMFDADIDDGGEVSINRFFTRIDDRIRLDDRNFIEIGFGYELDSYDFSGSTGFGGLDPWGDVHRFGIRAIANSKIDDQWNVFFGPIVGMAAESGALDSNAIVAGGQVGAAYVHSDDLRLGFGLSVTSQIEDDARVIPILFFNWKIDDDWTLRAGNFHLGAEGGPGLELAYQFTETVEFSLGTDYTRRRFRLDDDDIAPEGVGQTEAFSLYGKVAWDITPQTELSFSAGIGMGELLLEDEDGRRVSEEDFDPAPIAAVRFTFRF